MYTSYTYVYEVKRMSVQLANSTTCGVVLLSEAMRGTSHHDMCQTEIAK